MLPKEVLDKLNEKFKKYETIENFIKKTKCPLSRETVRKALYEGKALTPPVLLLLLKYLKFSSEEMVEILKAAGDTEFYPLLTENYISEKQKLILQLFDLLEDKNKIDSALDFISYISKDQEILKIVEKIREA